MVCGLFPFVLSLHSILTTNQDEDTNKKRERERDMIPLTLPSVRFIRM